MVKIIFEEILIKRKSIPHRLYFKIVIKFLLLNIDMIQELICMQIANYLLLGLIFKKIRL